MKEERKLVFLSGEMGLAVFDDQVQMRANQTSQRERDHPNVSCEKTLQSKRTQVGSATQGFEDKSANEGNASRDLRTHRSSPVGSLVPRKQIAGEPHANGGKQKTDPDQPRHL